MKRQRNDGLRKICKCSQRAWVRCAHPWYFSFKPRGRARVRVSLDRYTGKRVESLEDAKTVAAGLRTAVANGQYPPPVVAPAQAAPVSTVAVVAQRFLESVPILKGKNLGASRGVADGQKVAKLCAWTPSGATAPFGSLPVADIPEDVLEGFVGSLRASGRTAGTIAKYLQLLKSLDRWMVKKGYRAASAFSGDSALLRRSKPAQRERRLVRDTVDAKGNVTVPGEEKRLIAVANQWLGRLIIAALETDAGAGSCSDSAGRMWTS